jgi:hypothetical protein
MKVMQRMIHQIRMGKWQEAIALEKEWVAFDTRRGVEYPTKRYYGCMAGGGNSRTFVWEREWESLATYEAVNERPVEGEEMKALMDKLRAKTFEVYASITQELYSVLELEGGE